MDTLKFTKNAKVMDTVFHVLQKIVLIVMGMAFCILLLVTIISMVNPDFNIGEGVYQITIGDISVTLTEKVVPAITSVLIYGWILLLFGAVNAGGIYYTLHCIRKILQPVAQGNPFYPSVGKDIRRLGWVFVVLGLVENGGGLVAAYNLLHNFDLIHVFNSNLVTDISADYTFRFSFLIIFFVLLLLSYIFEYGVQLQQLSDETL